MTVVAAFAMFPAVTLALIALSRAEQTLAPDADPERTPADPP